MRKNMLSIVAIIMAIMPAIATAGRHAIARDEASRIVEQRFAQFYQDEARRKQQEQQAMEAAILSAKDIEAAMLEELERSMTNQNPITTADELERMMSSEPQTYSTDEMQNTMPNDLVVNTNLNSVVADDNTTRNIVTNSRDHNPLLFLQNLSHRDRDQRAAGIKKVVASIKSVHGHKKLSEEFIKDLTKISPELAQEFTEAYNEGTATNNSLEIKNQRVVQINEIITSLKNVKEHKKLSEEFIKELTKISSELAKEFKAAYNKSINSCKKEATRSNEKPNKVEVFNVVTNYVYNPNNLYQIYTSLYKVTVLVLDSGEKVIGSPICGDPLRWKINVVNLAANDARQHISVQPLREGITTSITILTNQGRIYLLEATSLKNNYMAAVRWSYAG